MPKLPKYSRDFRCIPWVGGSYGWCWIIPEGPNLANVGLGSRGGNRGYWEGKLVNFVPSLILKSHHGGGWTLGWHGHTWLMATLLLLVMLRDLSCLAMGEEFLNNDIWLLCC